MVSIQATVSTSRRECGIVSNVLKIVFINVSLTSTCWADVVSIRQMLWQDDTWRQGVCLPGSTNDARRQGALLHLQGLLATLPKTLEALTADALLPPQMVQPVDGAVHAGEARIFLPLHGESPVDASEFSVSAAHVSENPLACCFRRSQGLGEDRREEAEEAR